MPQGLPKKIEIKLLLRHLALELYHPTPRHFALARHLAAQRRQHLAFALTRPTATSKRLDAVQFRSLLPLVQPTPVDPQIPSYRAYRLPGEHTSHRFSFRFY
jgi:hypothetical protein